MNNPFILQVRERAVGAPRGWRRPHCGAGPGSCLSLHTQKDPFLSPSQPWPVPSWDPASLWGPWAPPLPSLVLATLLDQVQCSDMGVEYRWGICQDPAPPHITGVGGVGVQGSGPPPATKGTSQGERVTMGLRNCQLDCKQATKEGWPLWAGEAGMGTSV